MTKTVAYSVGDTLAMSCSTCDSEQEHTVESVNKQGKISKAMCSACKTESTFTRGVKTGVTIGAGKNASPYDRKRKYRKGQSMTHDKFGHGEVTGVAENKMDVLFGDETRRLIHGQE